MDLGFGGSRGSNIGSVSGLFQAPFDALCVSVGCKFKQSLRGGQTGAFGRASREIVRKKNPPRLSLCFPYFGSAASEWTAYTRRAQERPFSIRSAAMADLIYLSVGILFLGLMGAYAIACDRL